MSQFIEMFDGEKYNRITLDSLSKEWIKGQSFRKDNISNNGTNKCIHYGELFTKYGPIIDNVTSFTDVAIVKSSECGDILFPASDVTPDGLARCSALMEDKVLLGGDIIVLRPKDGMVPEYLSWAINMQKGQLLKRVTGTVVRHMSSKGLKTVTIPDAPVTEQKQFISVVRQADKSEFDGFKSQFIEMFGNPDKTKQLSDFIETSFPGEWGEEDKDGTGVKVIRTTNFTNEGKLNLEDVVTRKIDSSKVEKKKLKKGDIILERSGGTNENPVGRVVFYDEDGTYLFNNFTQLLRCKEGVCPLFIFYSLFNYYQTNKSVIRSMGNKTTGIQNLKMDNYWKIPIADVSYDNQESFAAFYKQADKSEYVVYSPIAKPIARC